MWLPCYCSCKAQNIYLIITSPNLKDHYWHHHDSWNQANSFHSCHIPNLPGFHFIKNHNYIPLVIIQFINVSFWIQEWINFMAKTRNPMGVIIQIPLLGSCVPDSLITSYAFGKTRDKFWQHLINIGCQRIAVFPFTFKAANYNSTRLKYPLTQAPTCCSENTLLKSETGNASISELKYVQSKGDN
jgi:hypothetical protein